jgi:hypothetical protein
MGQKGATNIFQINRVHVYENARMMWHRCDTYKVILCKFCAGGAVKVFCGFAPLFLPVLLDGR